MGEGCEESRVVRSGWRGSFSGGKTEVPKVVQTGQGLEVWARALVKSDGAPWVHGTVRKTSLEATRQICLDVCPLYGEEPGEQSGHEGVSVGVRTRRSHKAIPRMRAGLRDAASYMGQDKEGSLQTKAAHVGQEVAGAPW